MEPKEAEQQKTFIAEKQVAYVRAIVIVFGTATFFMLSNPYVNFPLAYTLLFFIWAYGLFVILYRPYEKHPVFLAGWFTYLSDCLFATLWIYSTGGFYSPYHVMFYTSIIAVAFRFNLRTTMFTSALYTLAYFMLLQSMSQLQGNEALAIVRMGFIFIIGFMTNLITSETLAATRQKLLMQELMEEAQKNHQDIAANQRQLSSLNAELQLKNDIFRHAEENAAIGSYSRNLRNEEILYSDNLFRILGYEPGEFVPGYEKFAQMVHAEDRPVISRINNELLNDNKVPAPTLIRVYKKNGDLSFFKITAKLTRSGDDLLMIGTLQDVTADVKMSQELQEKNLELERSNKELSSFSYIASHDLQEPVRKILTFSELILDKERSKLGEVSVSYLDRILGAGRRMQHLILAFLNYSRIENTSILFEETDLNLVMEETRSALQDQIAEKQANIENDILPVIWAVPFQMQQLFINLIGNALKYSEPGIAPLVRVSVDKVTGKSLNIPELYDLAEYWKISIQDNGIGFEPQYSEKVFEVFQRLHTKDQYEGTGIGLAICKKIAQSHRGHIMATSQPGKGATFIVYISTDLRDANASKKT